MADAVVSIVLEKLANFLEQQLRLFVGASDEVAKLSSTFESIQMVLHDAESRQVTDESVQLWLSKLKGAAYDVDDLLDEWLISSHVVDHGNKVRACLLSPCVCLDYAMSRYKVACQVKEIRERLDQIDDDKRKYNFAISGSSGKDRMLERNRSQTSSLMDVSEMIGRDSEKEIIVSKLVSGSSHVGQVHVIALVGVGGVGKTTLARETCNNDRVKAHFNKVSWVSVSEVFDVKRLTKAILEDIEGASTSLSELNTLQKKLHEALEGKRFLLVLDDVWNDDAEKWKSLQVCLASGAPGSKILVTTRSEKVASTMNASYVKKLEGLLDDHCWMLFSSRAFAGREEEECLKLQGIGRELVRKCKGVPLSIKVMANAMHSKRTVEDWKNILDSDAWALPDVTEKILPALLLSYWNLPVHLKQCFAYCSIFPKDEKLTKDTLVKLWVAQGFIHSQGSREMEDIGGEYFDELVARSLFQDVESSEEGTKCKVHDLLHDLAQFIMKNESCIFVSGKSYPSSTTLHHVSLFIDNDAPLIQPPVCNVKKLRTLFLHEANNIDTTILHVFHQARFLRALHWSGTKIRKLPKTIGKLKHLRYLDLSHSKIVELPEAVSRLHNLQTLNLNHCGRLQRLPRGMGRMVGMRYLEITFTIRLECLPKGLGRISSLRSLSKFIVGGKGGCRIDELQRLNSLQGSLEIQHLERVSSGEEANKAELWKKSNLRKLALEMSGRDGEMERMENVLEGLRPHTNLEELKIHNYKGSKLPKWVENSSFLNLNRVEIVDFLMCPQLPGFGKLPALKHLQMRNVSVRKLGNEFYYGNSCNGGRRGVAFPKLEQLVFECMSEFEEWEGTLGADAGIMPSLCVLDLWNCPKLEVLPHHLVNAPLARLIIDGCDRIKGTQQSFPHLKVFTLNNSSRFFSSCLPGLPNLEKFHIEGIRKEMLPAGGWEGLVALQSLEIKGCLELKSLPDGLGQLKTLKSLTMWELDAL